jgi:uroporphyrinogen-III synthase
MSSGQPLIVTRPDPGGAATVGRAKALGLDARHLPLFAAKPMAWTPPAIEGFDALLVTSAQAARLAGPDLARLAGLPVYAVGSATAEALESAGLCVAMAGSTDGQDLLGVMTSRKIRNILWLCARDRSTFDTLGAALVPLPCYAVDPVDPAPEWAQMIAAPAVLLAHSMRGAARISELVGASRAHLRLAAISPKVAAAAGAGWDAVGVAERPDDAALLAQAYALCHKGQK